MNGRPLWTDLNPNDPQFAVQLIDRLLHHAVDLQASDVHLQPRQSRWDILFRIDGVLVEIGCFPRSETTDPVARLMVMANLPSYRASQPQEGRLSGTPDDMPMRLGTFPTVHGVRGVIRLLHPGDSHESLEQLTLPDEIVADLRSLCLAREGVVVMVGPAGCGKTTTLYACLRHIANQQPRRSVVTIEDPVESIIESISQSQLQPSAGMTLAAALRSAVRQDPEVLLVSEVRDDETAEAVLSAALTGHLCFSSIHASRAVSALQRLVQMNLPPYLISSSVLAVASQRLLRRLCTHCRSDASQPAQPNCKRCRGIGYSGRVAIAELIRFDEGQAGEAVLQCLNRGGTISQLHQTATAAGMIDLSSRASSLVTQGITDSIEVFRVLGRKTTAITD